MSFYVKGATKSKWHNPFTVKKHGEAQCLAMYKQHIMSNKDLMDSLRELDGKTLACWCCNWSQKTDPDAKRVCHGMILIDLIREANARSDTERVDSK